MICLSCQETMPDNVTVCPHCGAVYSQEKLRFIKYIGEPNSLLGYQKSYKLVLLKYIFEYLKAGKELSVDRIMFNIKSFYLNRVNQGRPADYDVDERIKNISADTSIYDLWAVFKANPYNVLNNQGFLFLEKNSSGGLVFVLSEPLLETLSNNDYISLGRFIEAKIKLYYDKHNENEKVAFQAKDNFDEACLDGQADNPCPTVLDVNTSSVETDSGISDSAEIRIEDTNLSARSKNCLIRNGYFTIGDLGNLSGEEIISIRGIGQKSISEIKDFIKSNNILLNGQDYYKAIDETDLEGKIEDTSLSVRSKNVLIKEGYIKIGDLVSITEEDLQSMQGLGNSSVNEIASFIKKICAANAIKTAFASDNDNITLHPIKSTSLSNRAKNSLIEAGFKLVGNILDLTAPKLCAIQGLGGTTVEEIMGFIISVKQIMVESNDFYKVDSSINYPYAKISEDCEDVPIRVLTYWGMSPSLIRDLQGLGINKLQQLKHMDYKQIQTSLKSNWFKLLYYTLDDFTHGIVYAIEKFLGSIYNEEDLSYLIERSKGATLQEIGNRRGITREGVRVKIEKPLKYIKPMAVCLVKALLKKAGTPYLMLQEIYDVYDNDDYDAILAFALNESEEIETITALGMFFIKGPVSYNKILSDTVKEFVGEGVFWNKNINSLTDLLQDKNLSYIDVNDIWLYMIGLGYKVYGEYVAPHAISYGVLLSIIIEESFPQGIEFSDANEMEKLRKLAYERFGDLGLPQDDRTIVARITNSLVLCDRGRWIAPANVAMEMSTLDVIKEYIDSSSDNTIYYQALFNRFSGLLAMTSDINNYHFLHGVLRLYYGDEYIFSRDYLQKKKGDISGSIEQRMYRYITEKGVAASKQEIKEHLNIFSDIMIVTVVSRSPEIIQWEYNYYNCMSNIKIDPTENEFLEEIINQYFTELTGYCSAKLLFDYCNQLMPEMLKRNNVETPSNIFYVVGALFKDKYKFRYPHILPLSSANYTTEAIARNFIKELDIIHRDDVIAKFLNLGWGYSTIICVIDNILESNYYRISRNEYIKKSKFVIQEQQIGAIKCTIDSVRKQKEYIGNWEINYSELPDLGFAWTPYLLWIVVENFIPEYRGILPGYGIAKVERSLYVPVDSALNSLDEIVISVMKNNGTPELTENEMYNALIIAGVVKHSIPYELKESPLLIYKDGLYTIKGNA